MLISLKSSLKRSLDFNCGYHDQIHVLRSWKLASKYWMDWENERRSNLCVRFLMKRNGTLWKNITKIVTFYSLPMKVGISNILQWSFPMSFLFTSFYWGWSINPWFIPYSRNCTPITSTIAWSASAFLLHCFGEENSLSVASCGGHGYSSSWSHSHSSYTDSKVRIPRVSSGDNCFRAACEVSLYSILEPHLDMEPP